MGRKVFDRSLGDVFVAAGGVEVDGRDDCLRFTDFFIDQSSVNKK